MLFREFVDLGLCITCLLIVRRFPYFLLYFFCLFFFYPTQTNLEIANTSYIIYPSSTGCVVWPVPSTPLFFHVFPLRATPNERTQKVTISDENEVRSPDILKFLNIALFSAMKSRVFFFVRNPDMISTECFLLLNEDS